MWEKIKQIKGPKMFENVREVLVPKNATVTYRGSRPRVTIQTQDMMQHTFGN